MTQNLGTEVIQSFPPPITLSPANHKLVETSNNLPLLEFLLELSTQNTAKAASKSIYWEPSYLGDITL